MANLEELKTTFLRGYTIDDKNRYLPQYRLCLQYYNTAVMLVELSKDGGALSLALSELESSLTWALNGLK